MDERVKKKSKKRLGAESIIILVLLGVYTVGLFFPVLWALITAFMDTDNYYYFYSIQDIANVNGYFGDSLFENFATAWRYSYIDLSGIYIENMAGRRVNVFGLFSNSIVYSLLCSVCCTVCTCVVAYATARFRYRFSGVVYTFVIIAMSLPIVGSMPSELRMLDNLGFRGEMIGMGVLKFNFLNVYYLILFAVFRAIPADYSEAAKIDGANNLVIMLKIIIPQAFNMILTVFILSFIIYWNDLQVPLVYIPDYPLVSQLMYEFSQAGTMRDGNYIDVPVQLACSIIMSLPIILVFSIFNKRLRVSVAMGGIKG